MLWKYQNTQSTELNGAFSTSGLCFVLNECMSLILLMAFRCCVCFGELAENTLPSAWHLVNMSKWQTLVREGFFWPRFTISNYAPLFINWRKSCSFIYESVYTSKNWFARSSYKYSMVLFILLWAAAFLSFSGISFFFLVEVVIKSWFP